MRLAEIKKKYPNQWVLVEFSKLDKDLRVKEGRVLAHALSKDEIYKALLGTRGKNVSIEYCGKMPEDLAVMFCLDPTCGSRRRHNEQIFAGGGKTAELCAPARKRLPVPP